MSRKKLLILGIGLAMAVLPHPAAAQGGPAITIDPPTVEAPGLTSFTVNGSGYTLEVSVLPCAFPEGGDVANLSADLCDLTSLTPATPDASGNFSVTVEYDVPAEGMSIVAADADQIELASAVVTVGGVTEPTELAATGFGSTVFAIIAACLVGVGVFLLRSSRRDVPDSSASV